jgi:hypothetical protein
VYGEIRKHYAVGLYAGSRQGFLELFMRVMRLVGRVALYRVFQPMNITFEGMLFKLVRPINAKFAGVTDESAGLIQKLGALEEH